MKTQRQRANQAGLTLVELMVAMALMTVLTGTIVFIFTQAQNIFVQVDAKVQVYQYARSTFDQMERDLANVVVTSDMDFFQDLNKDGHYEPGEELSPGVGIDGSEEKALNLPPFAYGLTAIPNNYHYGMTLRSPKWYQGVTDNKYHAHDSVYFKTITQYQGTTTAAIVEYALVDTNRERPKLQKRLWRVTGIDSSQNPPRVQINDSATSTAPIVQDLCLYTTDVTFQFFIKNKRRGDTPADRFSPGTFYGAQELVDAKIDTITGVRPFPPFHNYWNGLPNQMPKSPTNPGGNYMIQCYYDRAHDGGDDQGHFTYTDAGRFHTDNYFEFPMMSPGDRIFIYPKNGMPQPPIVAIPANDYTIKQFVYQTPLATSGPMLVSFMDPVSVSSTNFQADDYSYRAGWLPPAVRVTLRIKDSKAKEIRTISRTFKVLSSS